MDASIKELDKEVDSFQSGSSAKSAPAETAEKMLLSESSGQLFAGYLEVSELAVEVERAVWQVERALKAQQERRVEKAELDDDTGKQSEPER